LEAFERLGAVRGFAADCLFALSRRFVAVRRLAVVHRFAAVRRFNGARFFRDERDAVARFLRFAIGCLQSEIGTLSKKICSHRGTHSARFCVIRERREPTAKQESCSSGSSRKQRRNRRSTHEITGFSDHPLEGNTFCDGLRGRGKTGGYRRHIRFVIMPSMQTATP
jgi:hypothetical protein